MKLRHRKGCDPRERTLTTCPCGVTDAYAEWAQGRAEDYMDRQEVGRVEAD